MTNEWHWNRFTLQGDLNGVYVIEASTNLFDWQAIMTNADPGSTRPVFVDFMEGRKPKRYFRAWRLPQPIFRHALASFGIVQLTTGVPTLDSFDSANPLFSTNGRYDVSKRRDGGDVANAVVYVNIGNAKVMGHVSSPEAVVVGPNGAIGSKAWVETNTGIEPGWATNYSHLDNYRVVAPFTNATAPASGTVDGTTYTLVLESGNYQLPSLTFGSGDRMRVIGHAILYVQGDVLIPSGSRLEIDAHASLMLYVEGYSTQITGGEVINKSAKPSNFQYYGLRQNRDLRLTRDPSIINQSLIATIYAPNASMYMSNGSGALHFMGAMVTSDVRISGSCHLHFDESLLRDGPWR